MRKVYIYTLSDPTTNTVKYVGKTFRLERRLNDHLKCNGRSKKDAWIKSLINKNLIPLLEVIEETNEIDCNFWEQYWISQFKTWGFILKNMTDGGDGSYGLIPWNKGLKGVFKHSEESKEKMSVSRKGKYLGENNPRYGKKLSYETIQKQIEKRLGGKRTDEQKEKISGSNSCNAKEIYCYNLDGLFIKKYKCGIETEFDGFDSNIVSKVCRGVNKTHKKHVFSFIEIIDFNYENYIKRVDRDINGKYK